MRTLSVWSRYPLEFGVKVSFLRFWFPLAGGIFKFYATILDH